MNFNYDIIDFEYLIPLLEYILRYFNINLFADIEIIRFF